MSCFAVCRETKQIKRGISTEIWKKTKKQKLGKVGSINVTTCCGKTCRQRENSHTVYSSFMRLRWISSYAINPNFFYKNKISKESFSDTTSLSNGFDGPETPQVPPNELSVRALLHYWIVGIINLFAECDRHFWISKYEIFFLNI